MARATTGLSYLTLGLVILGSLIFTVFVIVPQWGAYRETNKKYAEAMQLEVERQAFLDNLDTRLQDMQKYDKEAKELSLALPDRFMQSNIWVNIENMASSAGVTIDTIDEAKKVAKTVATGADAAAVDVVDSKLESWDTGISVKGNYSQIRAFVKNLEDSLLLSDLRDITVKQSPSADKNQPSDTLAVTMVVRTYVQP
jgi:Tfp pilus assembly protein PilO